MRHPFQLLVSEIFGPTIQGEGPATGQRAVFLRLAGCPVGCSWCDTRYTWDPAARREGPEPRLIPVPDVQASVVQLSTSRSDVVVITGGEPLSQQRSLSSLVAGLRQVRPRIHLETAGIHLVESHLLDQFELIVISPKLSNSGVASEVRINPAALAALACMSNTWFKFVVKNVHDLDEVSALEHRFDLRRVMVMAEGTTPSSSLKLTREIADEAIHRGWSVSPRMHIWLWGNARGR